LISVVILSEVIASLREAITESKDPTLPPAFPEVSTDVTEAHPRPAAISS